MFNTFFQLALGLTWTKYLDGVCITNSSNHLIVIFVELVAKLSIPLIFC